MSKQGMESGKRITTAVETIGAVSIGFLFIFFFLVWPEIFGEQIGSYPVMREADGTLIPLNRTIYKVNPLMQTIIYWMPGIDETPHKLFNCVVRDEKNWIGYYLDGSGAVEMRKGRIVADDPDEAHVSRWHWWLLHFNIL